MIPALIQSGWFDDNGMGTTEALEIVLSDFPEGMRKVILGPWQHSGNSKYDMHGVSFGSQALRFDLDYIYFKWFEHYLKGVDNGIDRTAPVEYYTVGQETCKTASNWPVPETIETDIFLDSNGQANTSAGDGLLSFQLPERKTSDSYDYDPKILLISHYSLYAEIMRLRSGRLYRKRNCVRICCATPLLRWKKMLLLPVTL